MIGMIASLILDDVYLVNQNVPVRDENLAVASRSRDAGTDRLLV